MRIAHLSDLHALHLRGVSPFWFLNKRLAGGLNLLLRRGRRHGLPLLEALCDDLQQTAPDHVVVTGDLSNLSLPSELRWVRQVLDRLPLGPQGVTVIPGNHDIYVREAQRARYFERCLGPYALGDEPPADGLATFPFVRVRGELALIGACTARPSPPPLADGQLGRRQLAALRQVLTAHKGRFRLLLLHHPPWRNRWWVLRGLRDRHALARLLAEVGCELVLHGHEHRDEHHELPGPHGPIPVLGVGSGTCTDPHPARRARYAIYTIEARRLVRIQRRVHDPATGRFVDLP
ncbi:MAG: metallophosphoesterase [Myxococcales bacterium]|nr:metallophosphoesterase [Myxococcota bacterium]MDW8281724.1 metallophosphoesterase [Myxococcales bacterium]